MSILEFALSTNSLISASLNILMLFAIWVEDWSSGRIYDWQRKALEFDEWK